MAVDEKGRVQLNKLPKSEQPTKTDADAILAGRAISLPATGVRGVGEKSVMEPVVTELTPGEIVERVVTASDRSKSWRLIHDGTKVLQLSESVGITRTINTLELFETKEEADARVTELGLTPLPPERRRGNQ